MKKGKTTITASMVSNPKKKANCKITVKKPSLTVYQDCIELKKGKKAQLNIAFTPADAKVKFKSSNKKVASVSSTGLVKGKKKGKAMITVSCMGIKKKVEVWVS